VSNLLPIHETQLVSYLKSTGMDVGLLINFGAASLQVKRKYRTYRPASASASQDRITGFSGFTGPVSAPASASNPVNPANPVILSQLPEQGGAGKPPANPTPLSNNGAWQ